jgi:tetratricopeptide (TPR) repeat protein
LVLPKRGIKEYKTLIQPTAIDEQWVGMCYFMLNQSQKAIAHVQVAIFQGNHLAHISLAHIYLFSGHTELVLAELEKLEFDDLPPYHQHLFLINRSQYYENQCNLQKAHADAETAWSIGQTLSEWPLLISRNAFLLSMMHSEMGNPRVALWYLEQGFLEQGFLEQGIQTGEETEIKALLMRADILIDNGHFPEAQDVLENIQMEDLLEVYQPGFCNLWGYIYLGYDEVSKSIAMFEKAFELGSRQPINRMQHEIFIAEINLTVLNLHQGLVLKAQEHLINAKIRIGDNIDKMIYRFRDISLQQVKNIISVQRAREMFEALAKEFGSLSYLLEESRVKLHIAEMKRKIGEDIQNDLDELHCLGVAMQNPNFLAYEWILLPELFEIARVSHPSLIGNKKAIPLETPQNTIELEFLNHRKISINGQPVDFPLKWCEILALLAKYPQGLSSEELLAYLYGDAGNMSTLKATLSKLREHAPIASRPYRLLATLKADFLEFEQLLAKGQLHEAIACYQGALLPTSQAPGIVELRTQLEETLRQTVLHSGNTDLWFEVAKRLGDDLEVWEKLLSHLPINDPKYPYVLTKVKRIKQDWQMPN